MKFAVVGEERREAQPHLSGKCPFCGNAMIAKCGERRLRVWHWAHQETRTCDPWWEETDWHRGWKNQFPREWQEFIQRSETGEKHIADVKTDRGVVLEFQHSHLQPEERVRRENFYGKRTRPALR
jgi:competence protein CoiA